MYKRHDTAEMLRKRPETIPEYLKVTLKDDTPGALVLAVKNVIKALEEKGDDDEGGTT